jgi:hypothetical protein
MSTPVVMPRPKRLTNDIPVVESAQGAEREALAQWWKQRIQDIERIYEERIEVLRNVGEHPSPVFAKIVRMDGALGMPKSLVAKKLGISVTTLMAHYGDEYDLGTSEIISQVAANMLRIGTSLTDPNNARVGMAVLDRRGGDEWRAPAQKLEVENKRDGPPIIDSSKLTFEDRAALREIVQRAVERAENGELPALESDAEGE